MTLTFKDFQIASKRTMPFQGEPANKIELDNILSNYTLGTMGEYFELMEVLDKVGYNKYPSEELIAEVVKETGDVMHYLFGLLTILKEDFDNSRLEELVSNELIQEDMSNIAEVVKKHVYHGHDLDKDKMVNSIYRVISHFNTNFDEMMGDILNENIEKLKKRYPEKFTTEDSIARKDVE